MFKAIWALCLVILVVINACVHPSALSIIPAAMLVGDVIYELGKYMK